MRVGSLVYATDQGLGILAKSFVDHGVVTDVVVISHGRHPNHLEWYPEPVGHGVMTDLRSAEQRAWIKDFCTSMDVMMFFETPFLWELIPHCRDVGVKTVIMPMHECMPAMIPAQPDLWICPSELDLAWTNTLREGYRGSTFIPVPVEVPWRQRTKVEVFVHNAGHGGLKGRNGTADLLEAMKYVKSPVKLLIRSQDALNAEDYNRLKYCDNIEYVCCNVLHEDLWKDGGKGDAFVFPERFNGLSLPLQEARAAGMLVICGDRFPMNQWLPSKWSVKTRGGTSPVDSWDEELSALIPVKEYVKEKIGPPYNQYDSARYDPRDIAVTIDSWYGKDITEYSLSGKAWAETMSWEALKPRCVAALENLLQGA